MTTDANVLNNAGPIKDEALLDAEQWERSDAQTLFEACLMLVNAGIKAAGNDGVVRLEGKEIVVVSWAYKGKEWNGALRYVVDRARIYRRSRKNRKRVEGRLLMGLPPWESGESITDHYRPASR